MAMEYAHIQVGSLVYWADSSDDALEHGELGEVRSIDRPSMEDDGHADCQFKERAKKRLDRIHLADLQKGNLVYVLGEDPLETLGEVKGAKDGKYFQVEIQGALVSKEITELMRCQVQPGMMVHWMKADPDVKAEDLGEVQKGADGAKVSVTFPGGTWSFAPSTLIPLHVQKDTVVQWTRADENVVKGDIGLATGKFAENLVEVKFRSGVFHFKSEELHKMELQIGSAVQWTKSDSDVKKGDIGRVLELKTESNRMSVQFSKGTWNFKVAQLVRFRIQPGQFAEWKKRDDDIKAGDIGKVMHLVGSENRFKVYWPQGGWKIRARELELLHVQLGDRVVLNEPDDRLPDGELGQVVGVYPTVARDKVYVSCQSGVHAIAAKDLKATSLNNAKINKAKRVFKRYDANGDGMLSLEELQDVLKSVSQGALSQEDVEKLLLGVDRDQDGKVSVAEFVDYFCGGGEAEKRKLLMQGFGLLPARPLEDEDDPEDRGREDAQQNQDLVNPPQFKFQAAMAYDASELEGIDGSTTVSCAEWTSAMLSVGVCRAAATEAYEKASELKETGEPLTLADLSYELNGIGGAGVSVPAELCAAIGRVKQGKVSLVDMGEISEVERELALRTGLDGLQYHLHVVDKATSEALTELPKAKLSALEEEVLSQKTGEELQTMLDGCKNGAPQTSCVSSWQRAREHCRKEVRKIIAEYASSGQQFKDAAFNVDDPASVLYVDGKMHKYYDFPKPSAWKRASELRPGAQLASASASADQIIQGRLPNCYFLGALGSICKSVKATKTFLRQVFVDHDVAAGVYGVLFCADSKFTYVIVDDYLPVDDEGDLLYAKNRGDGGLWVSILEKAYAKYYGCYQTISGGQPSQAMYSLLGGVTGDYDIHQEEMETPLKFFQVLSSARSTGETLVAIFIRPSRGKYKDSWDRSQTTFAPFGLLSMHAYSLVDMVEVEGHQLVCFRNPWGHGEYSGPWSDGANDWEQISSESAAKLQTGKEDGMFWMAAEDYTHLSSYAQFLRSFGPTWQCSVCYGRFSQEPLKALCHQDFVATASHMLTYRNGDFLQLKSNISGPYGEGWNLRTKEFGMFRAGDVQVQCDIVHRFEITVSDVAEDAPLICALMREDQQRSGEWWKMIPSDDASVDDVYSRVYMYILDNEGKRISNQTSKSRHAWTYLKVSQAPFSVYLVAEGDGRGKRFQLQCVAPHGYVQVRETRCTYSEFLEKTDYTYVLRNAQAGVIHGKGENLLPNT